jgi:hypothetical protein
MYDDYFNKNQIVFYNNELLNIQPLLDFMIEYDNLLKSSYCDVLRH